MTPERWSRIKEIFGEALEKPEADRRAYLESACGGDAELCAEVEKLLAGSQEASLRSPTADMLARVAEFAPGEILAHYRIEAKLGEGGMGAVYRAYDTSLHRQVALKVLPPEQFDDPDGRRRLVREARAASALNHPNIVTVFEIGSDRGVDFIAMEYVEGRSLAQLIPPKGLPVKRALQYAVAIADGLAQAHAAGVVHRDLKPGNVMVNAAGHVKLLDFGLARRVRLPEGETGSLTVEGVIAGTPAYMAPEQAEGRKTDERTDVFAFGALLYEMLSGRRAFQGDSTLAVLGAVLREDPPPLAGVPRELERLVSLCMKKDPARRLQNIGDAKLLLEGLSAAEPAAAAPKRRTWLWPAALTIIVVAAIGSALWLRRLNQPASRPRMTQLTFDSGLTMQPAISPDGRLLAYASDRGGERNLDIWVQQTAGGDPIQVTKDPADDSDPAFSPDGSQIVFRSEREGGGIYVVPALGGGARLIARSGRNPRFSPDGSQIACLVGRGGELSAALGFGDPGLYVVASRGGPSRRLQSGLTGAGAPVWAPDSMHVLCKATSQADRETDWWVVPVNGGPAIRTRAREALRKQQAWVGTQSAKAWVGTRLIFSLDEGDISDLWRIPISTETWQVAGSPQRLTFGAGKMIEPSVSAGGQVVFTSLTLNRNVWSLAIDSLRGVVKGELQRLTREAGRSGHPTVSPDGRMVAFWTRGQLHIRDVSNGKEAALSGIPPNPQHPSFSPDSSKVIFTAWEGAGKHSLYVVPAAGGVAEKVCEGCGDAPAWSSDATKIVYDKIYYQIVQRRSAALLELATGKVTQILKHPAYDFVQPQFCPGDRWISFACVTQPDRTRLMVAPFRGAAVIPESEWIPVTDGSGFDVRPRWSPDGNLLYFTSDRDGFRCIWAQRLAPATKRPVGPTFNVHHFHDPQRLLSDPPELGFGVARDKMAFNLTERTGNIWTFRLPEGN